MVRPASGLLQSSCACSDPDLPLLDAFKGAILASKPLKLAGAS